MSAEYTGPKWPDRVYKEDTRNMFARGAMWMKKEFDKDRFFFPRIEITLEPGTYVIEPGETLVLSAFPNDRKTTAEADVKKPDYNIRLRKKFVPAAEPVEPKPEE